MLERKNNCLDAKKGGMKKVMKRGKKGGKKEKETGKGSKRQKKTER